MEHTQFSELMEAARRIKDGQSDVMDGTFMADIFALKAQRDELLAALERISQKCPAYKGDFAPGESMSLSDFGGNGDDLAYESAQQAAGGIGDIARALIAKHKGASHG